MQAENLLGVTKNFLSPDMVNRIGSALGETAEKTQQTIKTVIPAFLIGMVDKSQTTKGAEILVNLVNKDGFDDETTTNISSDQFLEMGADAVQGIFGNNLDPLVSTLEKSTGMKPPEIIKMLDISAPIIFGVLAKKIRKETLSTSALMGYLGQQKSVLTELIPGVVVNNVTPLQVEGIKIEKAKAPLYPGVSRRPAWVMVTVLALGALTLLWWFAAKKYVTKFTPLQTPTMSYQKGAGLSELSTFLRGNPTDAFKSFRFESLKFEQGTANLLSGYEAEIGQLANTMKAYPTLRARIEGHTDNTGVEVVNLDLSSRRAMAVKEQLVARGIDPSRIQALGVGSTDPLSTNATEQGRGMNRRIEFVIFGTK